jgi:hypothetical protein
MSRAKSLVQRALDHSLELAPRVLGKAQIEELYAHVAVINGLAGALENAGYTADARVLIQEFQSDVLQSLVSISCGFGRLARISLRGALEDCVFFLFFLDHPHEFELWSKGVFQPKVKETNSKLRLYHLHVLAPELNWWLDVLDHQYGSLSRSVHPSAGFIINDLSDPINLQTDTVNDVADWAVTARALTRTMIALLYVRFYHVFEGGRHMGLKEEMRQVLTQEEVDRLNACEFVL